MPSSTCPAASALAHMVAHSRELASTACSAGALAPLVACLSASGGAPDTAATRRFAASALSDITRHSVELATAVVTAGAVGAAASQLRAPLANDARLKRLLLSTLMYVARGDAALAEKVVAAGLIPDISRWALAEALGVGLKAGGQRGVAALHAEGCLVPSWFPTLSPA